MTNLKVFKSTGIAILTLLLVMIVHQIAYAEAINPTYTEAAIPTYAEAVNFTYGNNEGVNLQEITPVSEITPEAEITSELEITPEQEIAVEPEITPEPEITTEPEITSVPEITAVSGINLDKTSAILMVGDKLSLLPVIIPSEASNKNIYWTSSDRKVAAVDASGAVRAISEGKALITATTEDGGFSITCSIYVFSMLTVPDGEFAVPKNYDATIVNWSRALNATGYEVYRANTADGKYVKVASIIDYNKFNDTGLKTGTVYYYKVRAYKTQDEITIYSDYTPVITVKTLDRTIGSTLFVYLSELNNRNSVLARAIEIHYGDPHNTCAITVSESLRRIGMKLPVQTFRTNQVESQLKARGYLREMNLNLLQPGDICFTTDAYGNLLGGHSTHTFTFMGWANKEKTLMNIVDNQTYTYGSVLHSRTIFRTKLTDATAFFYHTNITDVGSILKLPQAISISIIAYNKVKLTWGAANCAYGYQIFRSTSKYGTYTRIATTRYTSYIDSTALTGRTYYYKVRAYNNVETTQIYGSYSGIYAATPRLSAPSALTNSFSGNKIKLSWKGVSAASGYQIYRATSKNGTYTRIASTTNTSYTNSGLINGKIYYYKVRAYKYLAKSTVYSNYSQISLKALY